MDIPLFWLGSFQSHDVSRTIFASAMIEKKLAKKLKVFRITDIPVVYTTSSF